MALTVVDRKLEIETRKLDRIGMLFKGRLRAEVS